MGYLDDAFLLSFLQNIKIFGERCKGIIGSSSHNDTALKTIRVVAHYTIERIRRSAHHHIPQKPFDMHIHRLSTSCLTFIAGAVVSLTEHHGKVAHGRFPLLRHGVGFRSEGEGVFAFGVGKTFSEIGHGIVQRQTSDRKLRFFRLLLLVLCRTLLDSPVLLRLQIHLVHILHFFRPGVDNRVNTTLS